MVFPTVAAAVRGNRPTDGSEQRPIYASGRTAIAPRIPAGPCIGPARASVERR